MNEKQKDFIEEVSHAQSDFVMRICSIADKYNKDRNETFNKCLASFTMFHMVSTLDYIKGLDC